MHTALDQNFITAYHVKKSTFCYYSRITIRVTPVKHYSLELEFPILVSFGKKFSR